MYLVCKTVISYDFNTLRLYKKQTADVTTVLRSKDDFGFISHLGTWNAKYWGRGLCGGWSECGTLLLGYLANWTFTWSLWQVSYPPRTWKGSSALPSAVLLHGHSVGVVASGNDATALAEGGSEPPSLLSWPCPHNWRDHVSMSTKEEPPSLEGAPDEVDGVWEPHLYWVLCHPTPP